MVATSKRVLVVDDEAIVCKSYERVLTDAGYSVRTARNGQDALEACRAESFDVMLADLKMPDMDGLEVTRRVKTEFPQVQILIITGYPTQQSADEARGLGVFDYLPKPLSPEQLSAVTAAALTPQVERTEVPTSADVSKEIGDATETETVKPDAASAPEPESMAKTLAILALAPVIGLAYIMLLPIIGFGVLFSVMGTGVAKKVGLMKS